MSAKNVQGHDQGRVDRRSFLAGGLAVGAGAWLATSSLARAGSRASSPGKTLVLVQLTGGNDGLSMVVPYADDAYNKARPSLRIAQKDVLELDEYRGLNPNLKGLKAQWESGHLAIVEGCGYPQPNRSHFESFEIWHTGSAEGRLSGPGWVGKLCEHAWAESASPELVVHLGTTAPYSLFTTKHPPLTLQTPASYRWAASESQDLKAYRAAAEEDARRLEDARNRGRDSALARLRGVLADANESSQKIRRAAASYKPRAEYPDEEFAETLKIAAALIDARIESHVVSVELGGFDTHNEQRNAHDALMRRLDGALNAFSKDLAGGSRANDVIVLVFSEFGRRVQENGSRGTDHGAAAPMLVLGSAVTGGLYGKHPSLTALDAGDLAHTTDFRSVYGTVIDRWFGAEHAQVLGASFAPLEFITKS